MRKPALCKCINKEADQPAHSQSLISCFHRNDITTLAFYGHGSEAILFFSMWQGKVIHFPVIIWFYKHFLWDILQ